MDFATFVRRVGANLRRARWAAGKTQEDVAAAALTFRLLGALERGQGNPTLRSLFLLAQALDVTVADLVDVEPQRRRPVPLKDTKVSPPKRGRKPRKIVRR